MLLFFLTMLFVLFFVYFLIPRPVSVSGLPFYGWNLMLPFSGLNAALLHADGICRNAGNSDCGLPRVLSCILLHRCKMRTGSVGRMP
jgi:hypothetical protein